LDLRGCGGRGEEAEPIVTKTKRRKKTKEKRVCQQLVPPDGMHPVPDSFSEIDPKFWKWHYNHKSIMMGGKFKSCCIIFTAKKKGLGYRA
jgi:hypothetical protein